MEFAEAYWLFEFFTNYDVEHLGELLANENPYSSQVDVYSEDQASFRVQVIAE